MTYTIQLSVRSLVEHVFLSGSIDSGFRAASSMTDGTKAHQRVQESYGDTDQKEVYLQADIRYGDLSFKIDGRCDGLLRSGEETIDEIKSVSGDIALIAEDAYPVHWAQACCYAYMYAKEHGRDRMAVQLTYVHVRTEEAKRFKRVLTFAELEAFVLDVIGRYAPYAAMRRDHEQRRQESIRELPFPFDTYRAGQRKLAGAVYTSIAQGSGLFAMAPTGIGKTMSTLYPAVKAMGEGLIRRILYITAKTTTRAAAEDACARLASKGLCMQSVTLTAKDKICFQEETRCQPDYCEYADGYYDRINGAIMDILSHETQMTRPVIEEYARKHRVCPFEFSLDLAYAADAVICDYNYVFDPRVSMKRWAEEQKKETALLIDEAHNLVDRARDMYSAGLVKSAFLQLKREFKGVNRAIHDAAQAVNAYFIALRKRCADQGGLTDMELPENLLALLDEFIAQAEPVLLSGGGTPAHAMLLDAYFAASAFVRIAKLYDERFTAYAEVGRNEVRLKLFCLDPSFLLAQAGKRYRSIVRFSATLTPMSYYMDLLGGHREEDYTLSLPSPFDPAQWDVRLHPLSTRYRDRERTKLPIVQAIRRVVEERGGNYLVFFPSYPYLQEVYEAFMAVGSPVDTLVQEAGMTEEEREQFLDAFQPDRTGTLVGFAVLGGVFSEGVDLQGDRLTGVIIVGVGLPQLGLERNIIRDYVNRTGKNGYNYAYVYPGMNKVLQAGGRLIRSERDTGTLVLIDDRFQQPPYRQLLPQEWMNYRLPGTDEPNIE
ncbi:MAG: ATP-dependent DNA helicase [Paenibacillus dendritiformis]|uniref:ATP-dependent DNA helicase n=1 Tax=uncultured Paenibacillus sp. TaxID=227322 RepID=UPI0025E75C84|nr:ATP-dependent DNA helicase [uncultured Paenibacillus sp.]MDU5142548.1 ATP-dependent DNA helicase [Paenibacillus dendritiformis]